MEPRYQTGSTDPKKIGRLRKMYMEQPDLSLKTLGQLFGLSPGGVENHVKDLVRPIKTALNLSSRKSKHRKRRFLFTRSGLQKRG